LNYAHKNQNNFNAIFVPAQLNERIRKFGRHVIEEVLFEKVRQIKTIKI